MSTGDRLTRLRALVERLERLPASTRREWMLTEARARLVDVETGERPRAMRPLVADPPPDARPPLTRRSADAGAPKGRAEDRSTTADNRGGDVKSPAPADVPGDDETAKPVDAREEPFIASPESSATSLGTDGVLWLDDSSTDGVISGDGGDGDGNSRPWRRGLRG